MATPVTRTFHSPTASGPVHAWVSDADGRRYSTDDTHHRLLIEIEGHTRIVGRPGSGVAEFQYPQGLALLPAAELASTRVFVCDTLNHRIQVFDGCGLPRGAFGRHGSAPGLFAAPAGIALVAPQMPGDTAADAADAPLLAIADQWNNRVQIVTLDGIHLASIGATRGSHASSTIGDGAGWPFFRLTAHPVLRGPVHLRWYAPMLEVECSNGRRVQIDLAAAMLPAFDDWLRSSSPAERARAWKYFSMARTGRRAVPDAVLRALAADTTEG